MFDYNKDFDYFWDLIDNYNNFSFSRYADGEVMLMKGIEVGKNTQAGSVDNWTSPGKTTKLGKQLLSTLEHTENNYYYAIPGVNDSLLDYLYLTEKIKQNKNKISFVNLWINNNYKKTIEKYKKLQRKVILICNEIGVNSKYPFDVESFVGFPNDCVNFWEKNDSQFTDMLLKKHGNEKNKLFFISCGPVSEIIIDTLYKNNSDNTYIDVGSSIDEFVHGKKTRPYMFENSIYNKMISNF